MALNQASHLRELQRHERAVTAAQTKKKLEDSLMFSKFIILISLQPGIRSFFVCSSFNLTVLIFSVLLTLVRAK